MTRKPTIYKPVPLEGIPSEHRSTIMALQAPLLNFQPQDEALTIRLALTDAHWQIITHWVFKKKWNPKHRIPGRREEREGWEPFAEIMFRLLELCIQCHALPGQASPYKNGWEWFQQIANEWKTGGMWDALNRDCGKQDHLLEVKEDLRTLKKEENPCDPKTEKHTHRLIETALHCLQPQSQMPKFRSEYWRPLTKAWELWIKQLKDPESHAIRQEGGKVVLQMGQGKGKRIVSLIEHSPSRTRIRC